MAPKKTTKTINWSCVPEEILYEILLRLPVKSLCRFRCVSKSLLSVISDPKFMSAHFDRSLANPKMLLVSVPKSVGGSFGELICSVDYAEWGVRKWGSQPQSLIADYHGHIRHDDWKSRISQSVGGLSLVQSGNSVVICNPSTRESIRFNFPSCAGDSHFCRSRSYLGFDPVEKKYKVLSSWIDLRSWIDLGSRNKCWSYVITLGEEAWRSVECKYPPIDCSLMWGHDEHTDFQFDSAGICIDGVIYYLSRKSSSLVIGFDVRLETFKSFSGPLGIDDEVPIFLMEYGGCVAAVYVAFRDYYDEDAYQLIIMGVLTDIPEKDWKCREYLVPNELFPLVSDDYLAGSSPNGELVFVSHYNSNLIKLDCYDVETECMKEIKVRGPKGAWSRLTTKYAARVCRHAERLESLQGLSHTTYHYQRY